MPPLALTPFYVVFPEDEAERIRRIGTLRQRAKRSADRRASVAETGADVHIRGYAAECALAAFLGVPPSEDTKPTGNRGVTLRAYGRRFAARHNSRPNGDLRYMPGKAPEVYGGVPSVDIHVLVTGDLPTLVLLGWATQSEVLNPAGALNPAGGGLRRDVELPGYGLRWIVPQGDLRPMDGLLARCGLTAPPPVTLAAHRDHLASLAAEQAPRPDAPVQCTLGFGFSPSLQHLP